MPYAPSDAEKLERIFTKLIIEGPYSVDEIHDAVENAADWVAANVDPDETPMSSSGVEVQVRHL